MTERRTFINISGAYVDPNLISFVKQKNLNEVVIHVQGTTETVTVGKEYWNKLCREYFNVE